MFKKKQITLIFVKLATDLINIYIASYKFKLFRFNVYIVLLLKQEGLTLIAEKAQALRLLL